jgi:hypothetical protein
MKLARKVIEAVEESRIELFYADRGMTNYWNKRRDKGELRYFTGWYWYIKGKNGKVESDENGPFKSRMAAIKDCFQRMQMRV